MIDNTTCSLDQLNANRVNAQKSTGPQTDAGKQKASRNATRHALAYGCFTLMYDESELEYHQLLHDLTQEHEPSSTSEDILVVRLAQSYWLAQRAIRIASFDMNDHKQLALMMRYQTMHDRVFQASLRELRAIQKARAEKESGLAAVRVKEKEVDLEIKQTRQRLLEAQLTRLNHAPAVTPQQPKSSADEPAPDLPSPLAA